MKRVRKAWQVKDMIALWSPDNYIPFSIRLHPQAITWLKKEAKRRNQAAATILIR